MALIACRECGKQISGEAVACPHCGAKPKKKTSLVTWIVGGVFVVIVFNMVTSKVKIDAVQAAKTPEQLKQDQLVAEELRKKEERFQLVVLKLKLLRDQMREPASFVLEQALSNGDGSVLCVSYRAKNGFGGMNRESVVFVGGKVSKEAAAWNKTCTSSWLTDYTYAKHAL